MIEKITDQNLERYDSRLKEWCNRKFFEKGNYGKYQTTEEAGAVAFYPAPDTLLEGKVKFSFKETLPTNGDKGPENPSTITGVSSVNIIHCGKNIIIPKEAGTTTINGITFTSNGDGTYTLNGTSTDQIFYHLSRLGENWFQKDVVYTAKANTSDLTQKTQIWIGNSQYGGGFFVEQGTFTPTKTIKNNAVAIYIAGNRTFNNVTVKPQIEINLQATNFEIGAGTIYTISFGNTYYGGEIDLATGVMTVTHDAHIFTGQESFYDTQQIGDGTYYPFVAYGVFSEGAKTKTSCTCTHFTIDDGWTSAYQHIYTSVISGNINFFYNASTVADFKSYLALQYANETPVVVVREKITPYTVQLTPVQILSFTQINKYTPKLNTVYTDADSIQISYLKSPIRDEYEKIQAILSLGGNS